MSGYRWDPVFRVVPVNGAQTFYWLSDRLTDVGGHTRITLRYPVSSNIREDINRSLRPVIYGIRPEVDIECIIWTMADQQFLSEIESALMDTRYYNVFLSLDGGVTYREVVLTDVANAEPISGKTAVGARFTLRLRCVDLLSRKPNMMTEPLGFQEIVQDGGLEQWESASQPLAWVTGSGVGTVAQETTIIRSGANSAKVTRSDAVTSFIFTQRTSTSYLHIKPGYWYRFRAYAKGSIDMAAGASGPFAPQMFNNNLGDQLLPGGKTSGVSPSFLPPVGVLAASWTLQESYFRQPAAWTESHGILLRFIGLWTASQSLYYDDVSVYGPALRPGVSTW